MHISAGCWNTTPTGQTATAKNNVEGAAVYISCSD